MTITIVLLIIIIVLMVVCTVLLEQNTLLKYPNGYDDDFNEENEGE